MSPSETTCPSRQTCSNQLICPSHQTCPNDDPNFTKLLKDVNLVNKGTPEERSNLFLICVLTRTLLYSGVYVYRDAPWMPWVVGALALASIFQLTRPTKNTQWWSKKFQLVMAILVLISALFSKYDSRLMAITLFISLLGGIIQRSQTKMC